MRQQLNSSLENGVFFMIVVYLQEYKSNGHSKLKATFLQNRSNA